MLIRKLKECMNICKTNTACFCHRKPPWLEFKVGQCWIQRDGRKKWILALNNIGSQVIVLRDDAGQIYTRTANGSVYGKENASHPNDLVSLYVEPKSYEVDVCLYDYNRGDSEVNFSVVRVGKEHGHNPKSGPYFKGFKRVTVTEGDNG